MQGSSPTAIYQFKKAERKQDLNLFRAFPRKQSTNLGSATHQSDSITQTSTHQHTKTLPHILNKHTETTLQKTPYDLAHTSCLHQSFVVHTYDCNTHVTTATHWSQQHCNTHSTAPHIHTRHFSGIVASVFPQQALQHTTHLRPALQPHRRQRLLAPHCVAFTNGDIHQGH